jgi:heterodisulfide reductase subunit A-like polyferredoxin
MTLSFHATDLNIDVCVIGSKVGGISGACELVKQGVIGVMIEGRHILYGTFLLNDQSTCLELTITDIR